MPILPRCCSGLKQIGGFGDREMEFHRTLSEDRVELVHLLRNSIKTALKFPRNGYIALKIDANNHTCV